MLQKKKKKKVDNPLPHSQRIRETKKKKKEKKVKMEIVTTKEEQDEETKSTRFGAGSHPDMYLGISVPIADGYYTCVAMRHRNAKPTYPFGDSLIEKDANNY